MLGVLSLQVHSMDHDVGIGQGRSPHPISDKLKKKTGLNAQRIEPQQ
jgi:hypothetical protein